MAAGIDSLGATELQRALSDEFSAELPSTLLFDHPSIEGIASSVSQTFQVSSPHVGGTVCCQVDTHQVQATVATCVAEVLGTEVAGDAPLMAAGIDSLGATELQRALNDEFSAELPTTLLFDHPSIEGIVSSASQTFRVSSVEAGLII